MNKRKLKDENQENEKKLKFNIWSQQNNEVDNSLTPPTTPTNKYCYNIWKKDSEEIKPIKISELTIGSCMNRSLLLRVSFKSDKRGSRNGDQFVFHAYDGNEEIQVTVFAQQYHKFFELIQYNKTYELLNFNVKKEADDYPVLVGKCCYIALMGNSIIKPIDDNVVPEIQFNFSKVDQIKSMNVNTKCDIMAIVAHNWGSKKVGECNMKRELSLTDESKECIVMTLWGEKYNNFDADKTCVLVHNGIVVEFNGTKTVNCAKNTLFIENPDMKIAKDLQSWFTDELKKCNL